MSIHDETEVIEDEGIEVIIDDEPEETNEDDKLARLEREVEELRRERQATQRQAPREDDARTQPTPKQAPAGFKFDRQKFAEDYNKDPLSALANFSASMEQATEDRVRAARAPLAVQQARSEIERYVRNARMSDDELEAFNAMIDIVPEEALEDTEPTSLRKQLDIVRKAAVGEAYEKRKTAVKPRVPTYSAQSYGSSPEKGSKTVRLTKNQEKFFNLCKSDMEKGRLTKKDVLDIIKEEGIE